MKQGIFLLLCTAISLFADSTLAQTKKGTTAGSAANEAQIAGGTYFIVNGTAALTPAAASLGQNVFLQPFRRSGLQRWVVTKTGILKNISYTIKLAGDAEDLWFQPFPSGNDHTPVVSYKLDNVSYKITPVPGKAGLWYIKSIKQNGDALRSHMSAAASFHEMRFEPIEEGNAKFHWKFEPAGEEK